MGFGMNPTTLVIAAVVVSLHGTVTWLKLISKTPSPVAFETVQTPAQAFWLTNEYGPLALVPKPNRKQKAAIELDKAFAD